MSTQAATAFLEKVANDEVLRAKFSTLGGDRKQRLAAMVSTGRQHGFQFTEDEVVGVLKAKGGEGALNEQQLAGVAGGGISGVFGWLYSWLDSGGGDDAPTTGNSVAGVRG